MTTQNEHVALMAPVALRTWESSTILHGNQQESGRIEIPFRQPVMVIAIYPSVSPLIPNADLPLELNQSLGVPKLDDLMVYLDVSEKTRLTARFDLTRLPNTEGGQFVTLGSFLDTTGGARMLGMQLDDPSPVVGVNFAWKRDVTGGPYYYDVILALALHCRFKGEMGCCC